MKVKVDLLSLKALLALSAGNAIVESDARAVRVMKMEVARVEKGLADYLMNYYAMAPQQAVEHVDKALQAGKLFRVVPSAKSGMWSPQYLNGKRSPEDAQIGEAAKSASRNPDGTTWCNDKQMMCSGLIRNGWVLVPEEFLC